MRDPTTNPLLDLLGYQLRRASAAMMDALARDLASIGLRPLEASVLVLVGANPRARPAALGRVLGVQRANMTPLVAALEKRDLLAREEVDGRSHGLTLTAAGQTLRDRAHALMHGHDARLLETMGGSDGRELRRMLGAVWGEPALNHRPPARTRTRANTAGCTQAEPGKRPR